MKLSYEEQLGFTVIAESSVFKVSNIAPGSPAAKAGLSKDDELICVNDFKVENNLDDLIRFTIGNEISIEVFTQKKKRRLILNTTEETYYHRYAIELINEANTDQQKHFTQWIGLNPKS